VNVASLVEHSKPFSMLVNINIKQKQKKIGYKRSTFESIRYI
jgi:hypothetical protein